MRPVQEENNIVYGVAEAIMCIHMDIACRDTQNSGIGCQCQCHDCIGRRGFMARVWDIHY